MPMRIGDALPSFEGATGWLNESTKTAKEIAEGHPTLVYFWASSCGICKDNMPKLRELKAEFKDLKTIAVHMPRYEADTNLETVKETVEKYNIDDLCAIDNEHKLKEAFQNEQGWVPVYFLFDAEGNLKSRAAGEFGLGVVMTALERLFSATTENALAD